MTGNKNINRICAVITAIAIVITVLFMNGTKLGIEAIDSVSFDYEDTLFDDSYVHTIDISIDDWDSFIENATSEEYSNCDVTIDGETVKNVGIRAKGNTSLSTVSQLDSERYSLKLEFDCYDVSGNYKGLDKLCLNNLIQDYTMMKDYITYKLMYEFGVASPLVSYCYITVNGEDWGLYLAVEAVEDSFLERNYGTNYGDLYKPDSMSMGAGRGNGGGFDMKEIDFDELGMDNPFENGEIDTENMPDFSEFSGEMPSPPDGVFDENSKNPGGGHGGFGMGSDDAKLKYTDDDEDSYSAIFDSAKTKVSASDKKRLIGSLKSLNEGISEGDTKKIEEAVDTDAVLRYMVVHNFVVNGDSYTGSMIHNYYLYEEDGLMSMIPWDYNLAFGTFQAGDATGTVNDPIDTPLSISEGDTDRPMFSWIISDEGYTETYHEYYSEFIDQFYTSGYLNDLIEDTYDMIKGYVEKDPTKFCTVDEFDKAVDTIKEFVELRCQSIEGQLDGTIPSTDAGQEADSGSLIDASSIKLSDMGSMGGGFGGPSSDRDGMDRNRGGDERSDDSHTGKRGGFGGFPQGKPGDMPDFEDMPERPDADSMPEKPDLENMTGKPDFQNMPDMQDLTSGTSTNDYIYTVISLGAITAAIGFAKLYGIRRLS